MSCKKISETDKKNQCKHFGTRVFIFYVNYDCLNGAKLWPGKSY